MNTYYGLDSSRVSLKEYCFGTPWLLLPLAGLIKLCRIQLPSSSDDPAVENIASLEAEDLPEDVHQRFAPMAASMEALGFHSPIYHVIVHPVLSTRMYWATYLHASGRAYGRIHLRQWASPEGLKTHLFPQFATALDDGGFLVTSGGKPDLLTPESIVMHHHRDMPAAKLWEEHERHLNDILPRSPRLIRAPDQLRAAIERCHILLRDYNLDRGVFRPLTAVEERKLQQVEEPMAAAALPGDSDAAVMAEVSRLQNQNSGWRAASIVLVVSLILFAGIGRAQFSWEALWSLIPILFFHEMGHFLAMRWFGYKNLRLLFIPLLGAAVTGKHYNVPGWKKAVVALAGPAPGILLGIGLGVAGIYFTKLWLIDAALLLVILNGFNLLPFLPLDGGLVLHAVLFARRPFLDLLFRLLAIGGVFAFGVATEDRFLRYICIPMLIGLPFAWRTATIARRLRQRGTIADSTDDQNIDPSAANVILAEVRASMPKVVNARALAVQVLGVFETLNARPPGLVASIVLLVAYGVTLAAAVAFAVVFVMGIGGDFLATLTLAASRPKHEYAAGTTQEWRGPKALAQPKEKPTTLIATFANVGAAGAKFAALPAELPPTASLRLFGETLLATFPDPKEADAWKARLKVDSTHFVVDTTERAASVRVFCLLPNREVGKQLDEVLSDYFGALHLGFLIPPWSPEWEGLPAAERERYRKARHTYRRLSQLGSEAAKQPHVQGERVNLADRNALRDPAEFLRRAQAMQQAIAAEEKRLFENLRNEGEATVDARIIELWQRAEKLNGEFAFVDEDPDELPAPKEKEDAAPDKKAAAPPKADVEAAKKKKNEATQRQLDEVNRQMVQLMGQLPMQGDKPRPGSDRTAAVHGGAEVRGLYLGFHHFGFAHPAEGLPALAEWLHAKGCLDLAYGFESAFDDIGANLGEEP